MPKQTIVFTSIVVAALDKYGGQVPGYDLGRRLPPDEQVARAERQTVRLDVAEDEDLAPVVLLLDEVGARVVDAESLLLAGRCVGGSGAGAGNAAAAECGGLAEEALAAGRWCCRRG